MNLNHIRECQSGFHNPQFELTKLQIATETYTATLCDFCFCRIMDARRNNEDLTIHVLYIWAQECDYVPPLPNSIAKKVLSQAKLIKFINDSLLEVRNKESEQYKLAEPVFPTIMLDPESKNKFIKILEEDENTIKRILNDVQHGIDRRNIILRLWTGGVSAGKTVRATHVSSERNSDGSPKEILYDSNRRKQYFVSIDEKASNDVIYRTGVEAAPIYELKIAGHEETYLDGVPKTSAIWTHIKESNRSKAIIILDDIKPAAVEEEKTK